MDIEAAGALGASLVRVDKDCFPSHNLTNGHGNKLLWVLSLTKHIHGVGVDNRQTVCVVKGHAELLSGRFRCSIGIATVIAVILLECYTFRCWTKDLVCGEIDNRLEMV